MGKGTGHEGEEHWAVSAAEQPVILVLHGPNLNLLGTREPGIYGAATLAEIDASLHAIGAAARPPVRVETRQSNHEGMLVDWIQALGPGAAGIAINAGALTHTSVALRDALAAVGRPFVEVHLSNVHAREAFRHHSYLSSASVGQIVGLGPDGYRFAVRYLIDRYTQSEVTGG